MLKRVLEKRVQIDYDNEEENKLAKARKMRKPPGTLSLKKFGLGNLWAEKVWTQFPVMFTMVMIMIMIMSSIEGE